jgi:heme-degrading monooxygenase HmoA
LTNRSGLPVHWSIELSSKVLARVKTHAEERVRTQLRHRHKLQSRAQGYIRFSNAHLYDHLGLFKVPTTAGWRSAHAVA